MRLEDLLNSAGGGERLLGLKAAFDVAGITISSTDRAEDVFLW